jgi:hypothetical protein
MNDDQKEPSLLKSRCFSVFFTVSCWVHGAAPGDRARAENPSSRKAGISCEHPAWKAISMKIKAAVSEAGQQYVLHI